MDKKKYYALAQYIWQLSILFCFWQSLGRPSLTKYSAGFCTLAASILVHDSGVCVREQRPNLPIRASRLCIRHDESKPMRIHGQSGQYSRTSKAGNKINNFRSVFALYVLLAVRLGTHTHARIEESRMCSSDAEHKSARSPPVFESLRSHVALKFVQN